MTLRHRPAPLLPLLFTLIFALVASAGCASTPREPRGEPARIAFHNASGRTIASMVVTEPVRGLRTPTRLGEIAPLPARAGVVFERRANSPPLPAEIIVRWRVDGTQHERRTGVRRVVADAMRDDTLVVEVTEADVVRVYLVAGIPPPRW